MGLSMAQLVLCILCQHSLCLEDAMKCCKLQRLQCVKKCVNCGPTLLFLLTERELVTRSRGKATLWQTHPPVGARKSSSSSSAPNMFLSFTLFFWKSKSPQTAGQMWCMSSLLNENFPFPIWKDSQVTSSQLTRISSPVPAPHGNSLWWTPKVLDVWMRNYIFVVLVDVFATDQLSFKLTIQAKFVSAHKFCLVAVSACIEVEANSAFFLVTSFPRPVTTS